MVAFSRLLVSGFGDKTSETGLAPCLMTVVYFVNSNGKEIMMSLRHNSVRGVRVFGVSVGLLLVGSTLCFASKMSLDESIAIALRSNPVVGIAQEDVRKAEAGVVDASAAGNPKLVLDAQYQRDERSPVVDFGESGISLGSRYSRMLDLSVVQPIDVFGAMRAVKRGARLGKACSQYDFERQIQETIFDVTSAFYNLHRAKAFLHVQEENSALLEACLKDAQANLKAGTVAQFDVLRAQTELANARGGVIEARNALELAKAALNDSIGVPLDNPVDPEEVPAPDYVYPDPHACSDAAMEFRPEVKSADFRVSICENAVKAARLASKPKADVRLGYMYNFDPDAFIPKAGSLNLIFSTTVPFYDGGSGRAEVKKAESDLRKALTVRDQTLRDVKLDVQQACLSLADSRERAKAAEKLVEEAQESKRLASVSYKGGVVTQLDVLTAQAGLVGAETAHVNAVFDYEVALARLARSVGGRERLPKVVEAVHKVDN